MEILVFKTSVSSEPQIKKVEALLNAIPAVTQWNFDLDDCDNVLRIVADNLAPRHIESVLHKKGIKCQELK